jgi:hypothetical protein
MSIALGPNSVIFSDYTRQTSTPTHLKNRLINGCFRIDQQAKGLQYWCSTYDTVFKQRVLDRWILQTTGNPYGVKGNVNRIGMFVYNEPELAAQKVFGMQFEPALTLSWSSTVGFAQRIESIYTQDMPYQPVTFQVAVKSGQNLPTIYWAAYAPIDKDSYPFTTPPSAGTPVYNGCNAIASGSWTLPLNGTVLSATFTPNSAVLNGLMIFVYQQIPAFASPAQGTFAIAQAQVALGSAMSTFDYRSPQEELDLCQRYMFVDGAASKNELGYTYNPSTGQLTLGPGGITSYGYNLQATSWYERGGYSDTVRVKIKYDFAVPLRATNNLTSTMQPYFFRPNGTDSAYGYNATNGYNQPIQWQLEENYPNTPHFVQGSFVTVNQNTDGYGYGYLYGTESATAAQGLLDPGTTHNAGGFSSATIGIESGSPGWYTYGMGAFASSIATYTNVRLTLNQGYANANTPLQNTWFGIAFSSEL